MIWFWTKPIDSRFVYTQFEYRDDDTRTRHLGSRFCMQTINKSNIQGRVRLEMTIFQPRACRHLILACAVVLHAIERTSIWTRALDKNLVRYAALKVSADNITTNNDAHNYYFYLVRVCIQNYRTLHMKCKQPAKATVFRPVIILLLLSTVFSIPFNKLPASSRWASFENWLPTHETSKPEPEKVYRFNAIYVLLNANWRCPMAALQRGVNPLI